MIFTRNLTFQSKDLGAEAQLVLEFSMGPQTAIQNKAVQSIVWKVKTFPAKGSSDLQVTYVNQHIFIKPKVAEDHRITVETFVAIDVGHETLLKKEGEAIRFDDPTETVSKDSIAGWNMTGSNQDIASGFMSGTEPATLFYLPDTQNEYGMTYKPNLVLVAFIDTDLNFQESTVLAEDSASKPEKIWEESLAKLDEDTVWNLTRDATGKYKITKA